MNARLRWFSGWWGRPPLPPHTHYIWFPSSVHYLAMKVQILNVSSLFMWRQRMTAHSQAGTTWRQPPWYPHQGLSTDTPLCWGGKGVHIVAFRSARLTWYAQLWNLKNDSEDASCTTENLEFLHFYSEGTVCNLGSVLCFPMQEQGSSKPIFEDNYST